MEFGDQGTSVHSPLRNMACNKYENGILDPKQKYRSLFENAVEGVFQSSPEGRFLTVNPALARMLGYSSPEDVISNVKDIENQLWVGCRTANAVCTLARRKRNRERV